MGNAPSECNMGNWLRCCRCSKVLPPCRTFDDYNTSTYYGCTVYVYNGGEYYRPVGQDNMYECYSCFHERGRKKEEEERMREEEQRRREEEKKREEQRRREEEKKREEQRRREEEKKREEQRREEELNQRLEESQRRAKEQQKKQQSISEESKRDVFITHLGEFEDDDEPGSDRDELLEILSLKCSVPALNLSQLTEDQLEQVLEALGKLLFDEWISALPSLSTLQHTQVFITELCALSLQTSEALSLQSTSNHMQSLVESISQSAGNECESFLLTQALYLNLMHFVTDDGGPDTDAVLVAKRWAEGELSTDRLFLLDFLGNLTASLHSAVGGVSVFVLQMEIQCLKLLLSTLTHLNTEEAHSEPAKMLLKLVQTNQWTPPEAVTLLSALAQKYADDAPITQVLTMVQVNKVSPEWTDESGRSLLQALDFAGPERFHQDFQKSIRSREESSLDEGLAELKMFSTLDDSVIDLIKHVITGVLQYSENAPKEAPFLKESFRREAWDADNTQKSLSQLCKAVFDTKGWWPTVRQMLDWCALVLTGTSGAPQLVSFGEDPCVTAMFAASQVFMGNKLDLVLRAGGRLEEQTKEWSDFYEHLGLSLHTNMKITDGSSWDVYRADIVYGTINNFITDYFQFGSEQRDKPQLGRGFIIEEQSLSSSQKLDLSRLKDNGSLAFAADVLEDLLGKLHGAEMDVRRKFIKALFQVLHSKLNKDTNPDNKIISISKRMTRKQLPSHEVFLLTFLESLLKVVSEETEAEENNTSPAGKWCLDTLFGCLDQFQASETPKELFQKVSNLGAQRLWSPVEALNLLGALIDHHYDEDYISIMKILHLMETYQVSSRWTDENNRSLLKLLDSSRTETLIQHLAKSLRDDPAKSIDSLVEEIRQMKDVDEQTLTKSCTVVTYVMDLIKTGKIKTHTDVKRARTLSHSLDSEDLQEVLAVLCNAVNLHMAGGKWWPRANQMLSWCLLALSDTGKLLEMSTGEGKSCVIAMFAVLRVLRGEKVDVVSSSSVLCERDAEEWTKFYENFGVTVDTNTNKEKDENRKMCYQKDVVYGTIEAFAADHLRQVFEMKDVRPDRSYQCIIIDEVDSLLLDQGVQLTYLSSPMVSMQHLNIILAMIWGHVSQYGFLTTGHQTFVQGPPASFFKAIFDSIDTEESEIRDPMDILRIAEEAKIVPQSFTEDFYKTETRGELLEKLRTVSQDAVVDFFPEIEQYVPCGFTVYTLDDKGFLQLRKSSPYNNQKIPEVTFLVLEEGVCCPLYGSEENLLKPIAALISEKIQYTPCENKPDKISIPGFLKNLIEKKMSVWVQNAFLAMQLKLGREYVVENNAVCPVDFKSTGIIELNKKWGDGLQQFVEIKHQIKLSTMSVVTNYISNISFFEKYNGKIYGTTGTLGSQADMEFLQILYPNLSTCKMPTFNRRKLFEVEGILRASNDEWKSEIKHAVMAQISSNAHRGGRAALVICETINKANEIHQDLKSSIPGEIVLYCRSDTNSLSKIEKKLLPGDVIVATNLAGRGTDIKVSDDVNCSGGLFVILSFLSENTRVELQAFGRTARKGKPGSAQVIMSTEHLQEAFRSVSSLEEAKSTRDQLSAKKVDHMMNDVTELKLREDLFSEYCKTLQEIHKNTNKDELRAVAATMNEFWGIWLQTKSEDIEQQRSNELHKSLKADLSLARSQSESQTSPSSSIYHYIRFGNIALSKTDWDASIRLFEKAMKQDEIWAAIAFYNHAYCIIKQHEADHIVKARDDLSKAQKSLRYLTEEVMVCLQILKMPSAHSANNEPTSLEKQFSTKSRILSDLDKNISEAIQKLDELKENEKNAIVKKKEIFSLVSSADEDLHEEAYNLYSQGLQYVFTVEEEPRFCWEGLLVFCLGVLQIIGGALITAFTCGTLAQVGMGLITEGISDCITGIESMVTGEFSWKSWAVDKAISIAVSLIGFGIGKLIAKGFKAAKMAIKGLGKQLKLMPKFLSNQARSGLTVIAKTNMTNVVKHTAKRIAEEIITYAFGKAEEEIMKNILEGIKNEARRGIVEKVNSSLADEPLAPLVDSIILSHTEDKKQLQDLLKDQKRKNELLAIFTQLSRSAVQPFYKDLEWQKKLSSSISTVIDSAKKEAKGKVRGILTAIQTVHMTVLAGDAIGAALSLSSRFLSKLQEELKTFKKERGFSEKATVDQLSASDLEMLKEFRQDLANTISGLLADALVDAFHQKFSGHIISPVQNKVNGVIRSYARSGLKSDRTDEKLRAGQNNNYIAHMPTDPESNHESAAGKHSHSHAENIMDPMTQGTILDVRVLSETTGTKVVILTENSHGTLSKFQELNPGTKSNSPAVTLIYRPKSAQYPEGHYDVLVNNQAVSIVNKDRACLFHALARGLNPNATDEQIVLEANRLRSVEADALRQHPGQWEPFVKRKVWSESIRGGDWYMAEGAARRKLKESKGLLQKEVGNVKIYKTWIKHRTKNPGIGQIINADHQPPVSCIRDAMNENQNSRLAKAMIEVGTNSADNNAIDKVKKYHGRELPVVYVPKEMHRDFPSTLSRAFRKLLTETIKSDNVVGTFKLTILGSMVRCRLNDTKNFPKFQEGISKTRLNTFEKSFQQHSKKMVKKWSELLQNTGVITEEHLTSINQWIDKKGYNDQNDPYRNRVSDLL